MKIGISRPTKTVEEALEMLRLAQHHGFAGVQFKPPQYIGLEEGNRFEETYGELAQLARGGLIVYCPSNLTLWQAKVMPAVEFAKKIGAGHVCICGSVKRNAGATHQEAAGVLLDLGRSAKEQGIRISLHNHANSIFESREDILQMAELLDPCLCGLTLDTAHFVKGGGKDIESLVTQIQGHLLNVHLKDLDAAGNFCPLGRGEIDLRGVIERLSASGYEEWLIVDEESMTVPLDEAFAASQEYLRVHAIAIV